MKNRTITIISLILTLLLIYTAFCGIKMGNFQILSIYQLRTKNDNLNQKIEEASILTTRNYLNNIKTLEDTYDQYEIQKQKYEELAGAEDEIGEDIYEKKQYDVGYLWRVLGKYAQKRNVNLGIDIQKNSNANSSYNINFMVSGKYVNISQFITDIENNSDLYFRIYNFKMTGSSETVTATFIVRNINIDPSTITQTAKIPEGDF